MSRMVKALKVALCAVFFTTLLLPCLYLLGAKEDWIKLAGVENPTAVPALSLATFTNRQFQTAATEDFSKRFFLRKTCLKTALQIRDWLNFGQFHYGYNCSLLEGRDGVLFEKPYTAYHLERDRAADRAKYAKAISSVKAVDDFCRSIGADFVYLLVPDKSQVYPEYLPRWIGWLWDYSEHDIQAEMSRLCEEAGIKTFDGRRFLLEEKAKTDLWLFPPAGTHINALGNGLLAEALLKSLVARGRSNLKINPFLGVTPIQKEWSVDDDIGRLLNIWDTSHVDANPHYAPRFAQTNVTMNAGGAVLFGDCYRDQIAQIFKDAGLFAPDKIVRAKRKGQTAADFRHVIGDLKLVVMIYQSFNSGRLDGRDEEINAVLSALRAAREATR